MQDDFTIMDCSNQQTPRWTVLVSFVPVDVSIDDIALARMTAMEFMWVGSGTLDTAHCRSAACNVSKTTTTTSYLVTEVLEVM
jgi:hypothetical protein